MKTRNLRQDGTLLHVLAHNYDQDIMGNDCVIPNANLDQRLICDLKNEILGVIATHLYTMVTRIDALNNRGDRANAPAPTREQAGKGIPDHEQRTCPVLDRLAAHS